MRQQNKELNKTCRSKGDRKTTEMERGKKLNGNFGEKESTGGNQPGWDSAPY